MKTAAGASASDAALQGRPEQLDIAAPIVLTGRGGSGTRMFSEVLQQLGVFMGNRLNPSGDSEEWVDVLYAAGIGKLGTGTAQDGVVATLRSRASVILGESGRTKGSWGWKLPETMLVLPEVAAAFERARFMEVIRHPLDTCLRRPHMTSRASNPIGIAVLRAAYARMGWEREPTDQDPEHIRNAVSWWFQVEQARDFFDTLPEGRGLVLRYESLCDRQRESVARIAGFIGVEDRRLEIDVADQRRRLWSAGDARIADVWDICGEVAQAYGYGIDGSVVSGHNEGRRLV